MTKDLLYGKCRARSELHCIHPCSLMNFCQVKTSNNANGPFETFSIKRTLNKFEKSIGPCQPAQADTCRNFSLSLNFLHVKGQFYIMIQSVV